jgi:hypothetical protein
MKEKDEKDRETGAGKRKKGYRWSDYRLQVKD